MPDGWAPNARHTDKAAREGVDLDREAEKFLAYHASKGSRFVSWDRAFDTWLLNASDFARGRKTDPRPHPYQPLNASEMPWNRKPA